MTDQALSATELAQRSGSTIDRVEQLRGLGLLTTSDEGTAYRESDVQRVRLLDALERSGMTAEEVARAVDDQRLQLEVLGGVFPKAVELTERTIGDVAGELGVSDYLVQYVYAMWGLPAPRHDEPLREDDLRLWEVLSELYGGQVKEGDEEAFAACNRIFAEGIRKVVDGVTEHLRADFQRRLEPSTSPPRALAEFGEEARRVAPLVSSIAEWGLSRFMEHALLQHSVSLAEDAIEAGRERTTRADKPSSIAFLDLTGFSVLAEKEGDERAAHTAAALARLVQENAQHHGGRLVKLLGDGAMLSFAESGRAVISALDLVSLAPQLGLPAARVGIASGPVVLKDGDYFGRTVNLAARIADYARPGEVLVSDRVVGGSGGGEVDFRLIGPVELKGVGGLTTLHLASGR